MPPADILKRIVAARRERLGLAPVPQAPPLFTESFSSQRPSGTNPFVSALRAKRGHAVIAEVKMGSPRLGSLAGRFDPEKQAAAYAAAGAAALSVVVEPDFFFGSYELLAACKAASGLPAIAKEFVVDERQLDWAVEAGADAILLIASLYEAGDLSAWGAAARARGLAPLVETHDAADVALLFASGAGSDWEMVGINNRDLRTFDVDLERSIALRPALPAGALAVAESGIATRQDVDRLAAAGFDAYLVGESLLLCENPAQKLGELFG
ncbi:MAG: indole-3-glycerol phosphate synthase TrpC [Thermoanaerobaculia bacterium]